MKNSFNLNSSEWCDIVFEGKNKEYGAFVLRQTSWKRHLIAFGLVVLFTGIVAALPSIMNTIKAANIEYIGGIDEPRIIDVINDDSNKEDAIVEIKLPELPKFAEMHKFVPPVIVEDIDATNSEDMTTMEEITKTNGFIAAFNNEGSTDTDAIFKEVATKIMDDTGGKGKEDPDKIYQTGSIQVNPQFPGGEAEMYSFIKKNLNYPVVDQEMNIQGRVTVRFVVSKTGEITNIQLVKGISPTCDKEAMRVIKNMPRWIPGKQNGEPVSVYFILPVVFRLQN